MALEIQSISEEEWDQSVEFAYMLTKATDLLNKSADVEDLKDILKLICHPPTSQQYIDIDFKFYEHCRTPREIIVALARHGYINFMHTDLLRQMVIKVGDEQSKTLLKQYEDNFPRKKPLKRMHHPLPFEETEDHLGRKMVKIVFDDTNIDGTTMEDVERVRQIISRNTGIDESVIVYAHQSPG